MAVNYGVYQESEEEHAQIAEPENFPQEAEKENGYERDRRESPRLS